MLAKELNCPVMVLSQLSRAVENRQGDHRPQLSDLRESGSIEQTRTWLAFVFREEVYQRRTRTCGAFAELIIGKQRNGPVGTVTWSFCTRQTKYREPGGGHRRRGGVSSGKP